MMMRRVARRTARRTTRRIMRRRMMVGGMVLLAAGGTAAAVKLSQKDAQRIEQHTGAPPEQLEDDELQGAMQELGIQSQPLTAQDQAALGGAPPTGAPAAGQGHPYRGGVSGQEEETARSLIGKLKEHGLRGADHGAGDSLSG
jgi:hypothetical protein